MWRARVGASRGTSAESRRSAELDLGGSKPFDEFHLSAAARTLPEGWVSRFVRRRLCPGRSHLGFQQLGAEWQEVGTAAVGEEAEVADAHEAARKQV